MSPYLCMFCSTALEGPSHLLKFSSFQICLLHQVCCSLSPLECTSQSPFGQEVSRLLIDKCLDGRGPAMSAFVPTGSGSTLAALDGGGGKL